MFFSDRQRRAAFRNMFSGESAKVDLIKNRVIVDYGLISDSENYQDLKKRLNSEGRNYIAGRDLISDIIPIKKDGQVIGAQLVVAELDRRDGKIFIKDTFDDNMFNDTEVVGSVLDLPKESKFNRSTGELIIGNQ